MPVSCAIAISRLSTDEFRELDYCVMRHAFESQNELGRLADERIYQADLFARLSAAGMHVDREVKIHLSYGAFHKSLCLDLIVAEQAVYELKVVKKITESHRGQLLTYLQLLDLPRGKLINFRPVKVESYFVNAPLSVTERKTFDIDDTQYVGEQRFREMIVGLLRDWGTSLTLSLYQEALVSLLAGSAPVEVMLPIHRGNVHLGNQRFQLASPNTAFKLTAMTHDASAYEKQLARLIQYSPLRAIHWINITHHQVALATLSNPNSIS